MVDAYVHGSVTNDKAWPELLGVDKVRKNSSNNTGDDNHSHNNITDNKNDNNSTNTGDDNDNNSFLFEIFEEYDWIRFSLQQLTIIQSW